MWLTRVHKGSKSKVSRSPGQGARCEVQGQGCHQQQEQQQSSSSAPPESSDSSSTTTTTTSLTHSRIHSISPTAVTLPADCPLPPPPSSLLPTDCPSQAHHACSAVPGRTAHSSPHTSHLSLAFFTLQVLLRFVPADRPSCHAFLPWATGLLACWPAAAVCRPTYSLEYTSTSIGFCSPAKPPSRGPQPTS